MTVELSGFLAMPYGDELINNIANDLTTAAKKHGIVLKAIKQNPKEPLTQTVINQVVGGLDDSDFCVAILSGNNPNVALEIGYAFGTLCPLMLVSSDDEVVQVDLDALVRVTYPRSLESNERIERFSREMKTFREELMSNDLLMLDRAMRRILKNMRNALLSRDFLPKQNLYRKCMLYVLEQFANNSDMWQSELKFHGREAVLDIGRYNLQEVQRSGFATFYFPGEESWQANDLAQQDEQYLHLSRERAREKSLSMTRIYVLSGAKDLSSPYFRKFVLDDAAAGIESLFITEAELENLGVEKDFGLWDNEMLGVVTYTQRRDRNEIASTTHKYQALPLSEARKWRDSLLKNAKPCTGLPPERKLLRQTYKEQERKSAEHHDPGYADRGNAVWYHGSRQYLRLCNVVASPDWHEDFFRDGFWRWYEKNQKRAKGPRILICGLADYGMLYQMIAAVGPIVAPKCTFHVLDLSAVPLEMAQTLKQLLVSGGSNASEDDQAGVSIRLDTTQGDILDTNILDGAQFDIIATDALLTRFEDPNDKKAVVKKWHDLLDDGGVVLTTARTKHDVDGASAEKLASAQDQFVKRAVAGWRKYMEGQADGDSSASSERQHLRGIAKVYAKRIKSFPFAERDEVEQVFRDGGEWSNLDCESRQTTGELAPTVYVEVAATK